MSHEDATGFADGGDGEPLLSLPDEARDAFRDPLGALYTDADALLRAASGPLIAVGDVVTYHFERAGRTPDVALVDGRTQRERAADEVRAAPSDEAERVTATNPPGTLTAELLSALREAIETPSPVVIAVDGEEDLAAVPAILAAPDGASVVYGQPNVGMVRVPVHRFTRERATELVTLMEGDGERARTLLDGA